MRRTSTILWSSTAIAIAFFATPAAAQTDPTPPDQVSQTQPADQGAESSQGTPTIQPGTEEATETAAESEAIVVTGSRMGAPPPPPPPPMPESGSPVSPGELELGVSVSMQFELAR